MLLDEAIERRGAGEDAAEGVWRNCILSAPAGWQAGRRPERGPGRRQSAGGARQSAGKVGAWASAGRGAGACEDAGGCASSMGGTLYVSIVGR